MVMKKERNRKKDVSMYHIVADIFLMISLFLHNHQVSKCVLNFIVVSSLSSNNETGIILSVKRLMIMIMIMN
jgi:hypothetical protein